MLERIPDSLYDLAFQYKETRLWKKLWDIELFAVTLDDGNIGYCSVMGRNGEHNALAVYPGDEGLEAFRSIDDREYAVDGCEYAECLMTQDYVSVSFETQEHFNPDTWAELEEYCARRGIVRRGPMKLPNFERLKPYRSLWCITEEKDAAYIRAALEAALEISERLKTTTAKKLGFAEGAPYNRSIPLLTKTESGYLWSTISLSSERVLQDYPRGHVDEFTLARLKKVKKNGHTWSVRIFLSPEPVPFDDSGEDAWMEAPIFPFILMAADETDQRVLDVNTCKGQSDADFDACFTERFVKQILNEGKPSTLIVEGRRTAAFFSEICNRLDIQIEVSDGGDTLNDAVDHFFTQMDEDMDLDMDMNMEEETRQLRKMLNDPATRQKMPDQFLEELKGYADMGLFPEEIQDLIEHELQRRGLT